ncbi:MAG: homoserine O-acetyltransferase [Ignavibacteriales bacterium]|nr:homoserine O-acetyltransferase [Ignavibacteriales bacterium]
MSTSLELLDFVETQKVELYSDLRALQLESGKSLSPVEVAYETYGTLNSEGTNGVLICHALTANSHAAGRYATNGKTPGWWDGLIGPGKALDTNKYFVVCPNILGSCYGTTGPTSVNPVTGRAYRLSFPQLTVRDIVRVQKQLLDFLGIQKLAAACGSSLGGMQVLEWGIMYPDFCEALIPISTAARQPAWCIALNAATRSAITSDPEWKNGDYTDQPAGGLALARMIGMISYRSPKEFETRFGRNRRDPSGFAYDPDNLFQVESYLRHQGDKLVKRFDANTYVYLSRATDFHDVTWGRGLLRDVLGSITSKTLCIGVSSDVRYPKQYQHEIVQFVPDSKYAEINSIHGHDAFLIEFEQLNRMIKGFLQRGY